MKIENIIEDIKRDTIALKAKLEEQFKKDHPHFNFSVSLPGIEELSTIKSIALSIEEGGAVYYLSVNIHTHNGNRVFENPAVKIINNQPVPYFGRHPLQDRFVDSLRDIIKKNKNKTKPETKAGDFNNDMMNYARSVCLICFLYLC